MKLILAFVMNVFFVATFVSTAHAALPSGLVQVQKTFSGKQGFDVRFTQEVNQTTFKDHRTKAEGKVSFKRPSILKWQYEKPSSRLIEYDGKSLVITEGTEKNEVKDVGPLSLQESFSFLWGGANTTAYKFEASGTSDFKVIPRNPKKAPFKEIFVKVEGGKVSEARVQNHLEGESLLRFSDWKLF